MAAAMMRNFEGLPGKMLRIHCGRALSRHSVCKSNQKNCKENQCSEVSLGRHVLETHSLNSKNKCVTRIVPEGGPTGGGLS